MRIKKENIKTNFTSCNFCNKGKCTNDIAMLVFPYKNVVTFQSDGNGICASICEECLDELYDKGKKLFKDK